MIPEPTEQAVHRLPSLAVRYRLWPGMWLGKNTR